MLPGGPVYALPPVFCLIRKHAVDFRRIRGIRDIALSQPALPAARLRRQDVASHGMPAFNLAGARLLETFRRTLMGLQLWHKISWVPAVSVRAHQS